MANCGNTSIGKTPLVRPGFDFEPDHLAKGIQAASEVKKVDLNGNPVATGGKLVIATCGMSNWKQEFTAFVKLYREKYGYGKRLTFHNGCRGGWDAIRTATDPTFWGWYLQGLAKKNISPKQVQVLLMKNSVRLQNKPYPQDAEELKHYMEIILQAAKQNLPNLKQVLFSSAIYSGYSSVPVRKEPHAYNEGLGIDMLVKSHTNDTNPWIGWGAYLWADGVVPRYDGLTYPCNNFETDGVHPAYLAEQKVANLILEFFENNPVTKGWFLG